MSLSECSLGMSLRVFSMGTRGSLGECNMGLGEESEGVQYGSGEKESEGVQYGSGEKESEGVQYGSGGEESEGVQYGSGEESEEVQYGSGGEESEGVYIVWEWRGGV